MRALTAVALVLVCGCSSEPSVPLGTISSEQAQQLVIERDEARDAAAAREREMQAQIDGLAAEVADLRGQLGMAQETAEEAADRAQRYEQGLDKAVANEVSQAAAAPSYASEPTRRLRAERVPTADVSYYSNPRVSIVDRSVAASGRLFNSGDAPAIGTLYVDLLRDGIVVETKDQQMQVMGNSWANWQEEFRITPSKATYAVQAHLEY
mgnify:CR=1 FL=1